MEPRSKSQEDYLETILLLKLKNGVVRSVDIAETLNFSKPSISRAVALLRERGDITMAEDFTIELTPAGREKAMVVYRKHCILRRFLLAIGTGPEKAEEDACEIEHVVDDETCDRIECFLLRHGYELGYDTLPAR